MMLTELLIKAAETYPDGIAVCAGEKVITYLELHRLSNRLAGVLAHYGVKPADRVAIWLPKSEIGIAAMQAALRLGAAYVPLDPLSPPARVERIIGGSGPKVIITDRGRFQTLSEESRRRVRPLLTNEAKSMEQVYAASAEDPAGPLALNPNRLAYILFTSGSTGEPKGVCISHENALAFVRWAAETLQLTEADRLSNHAPFHFDLSVFDIYAAFYAGSSLHLIPEEKCYRPFELAQHIVEHRISVWYSVPSVLQMMMVQSEFLRQPNELRAVIFAGEVFPVKYVSQLRANWPSLRLLNFYGPTETNVCAAYEVKDMDGLESIPIGNEASGDELWLVDEQGNRTDADEGELVASGPTVMLGYWGKPTIDGKIYRTGDVVRRLADGNFLYKGRRDHMVKVRGNRIELGEIEAALSNLESVEEAVVAVIGSGLEAKIVAFVRVQGKPPSLLRFKEHCARFLPSYMIIDRAVIREEFPRTPNGKADRKRLIEEFQTKKSEPGA